MTPGAKVRGTGSLPMLAPELSRLSANRGGCGEGGSVHPRIGGVAP